MGVTGVHPTAGLTTGDAEEAGVKRALVTPIGRDLRARHVEKIGAASAFEVVPLAAVTAVLTDSAAPARGIEELRSAGVEVRRADVG